ncbi:hypothetical protein [uncultured Mameliella sp.]|mgnify:FL=1|uniref:hypothetical protein n=1 Tax=uncultured Mameliella sp. TaxID=1447087 RepID=UPI00260690DB|nr:hypothetical protein [uncultured Mameliella sp.]
MIGQAFADKGWQMADGPRQPRRFQVFGERSSGTNFVKRLVARNSALTPTDDMGWKHGFPHMTAIPADMLVICCVRDARAWSLSMHAKPWHCPPAMQLLPFAAFLRAEWATIADRKRYFPQVATLGGIGQPLQHDRHPLTGRPFANLLAMRQAKLSALLSFFERDCSVLFCRLEAVQAAPEHFVTALSEHFALPVHEQPFRPVVKRLGSKFLPAVPERPETPHSFPEAELPFLRAEVDLPTETALGYDYT